MLSNARYAHIPYFLKKIFYFFPSLYDKVFKAASFLNVRLECCKQFSPPQSLNVQKGCFLGNYLKGTILLMNELNLAVIIIHLDLSHSSRHSQCGSSASAVAY